MMVLYLFVLLYFCLILSYFFQLNHLLSSSITCCYLAFYEWWECGVVVWKCLFYIYLPWCIFFLFFWLVFDWSPTITQGILLHSTTWYWQVYVDLHDLCSAIWVRDLFFHWARILIHKVFLMRLNIDFNPWLPWCRIWLNNLYYSIIKRPDFVISKMAFVDLLIRCGVESAAYDAVDVPWNIGSFPFEKASWQDCGYLFEKLFIIVIQMRRSEIRHSLFDRMIEWPSWFGLRLIMLHYKGILSIFDLLRLLLLLCKYWDLKEILPLYHRDPDSLFHESHPRKLHCLCEFWTTGYIADQ